MNASAGVIADKIAEDFYCRVLISLHDRDIPFLVGGAYAFICYTGITRPTKDLDIFIRRRDYEGLALTLEEAGYRAELRYPHWLAKIHCGDEFVDVIFNSGNGVAEVDDAWFERSHPARVLDVDTRICPVEETIWSKAFIMERERYDGADIVHMLRACSRHIDWRHLLNRFGEHWRVLLIHLTAFGFVYPAERNLIPLWVMDELLDRLRTETHTPPAPGTVCAGPLLSREQYLTDIRNWGYQDARVIPVGNMTPDETARWTAAIREKEE